MIIEMMVDSLMLLIYSTFEMFNIVTLPFDLLNVFYEFCCYGAFVMGGDLLVVCFANISMWIAIRCSIGVVLFFWRLLPFT